jgi:hypothetical protein
MTYFRQRFLTISLAAGTMLAFSASASAFADPIPSGWTCSGTCGSLGANGVVTLSPAGDSSYQYVTTANSASTAVLPGNKPAEETNGSVLSTTIFSAKSGQALNFYFNFLTSDGSSNFADYAWAELFSATTKKPVSLIFTGQTEPTGSIVPAPGLPKPTATLTPSTAPIIPGGPAWSPLGSYSGLCYDAGCGYTGWIESSSTVASAGNYYLEFGATNWADEAYDTGLAIDGVTIGGKPITPPVTPPVTPPTGVTPEPSTFVLFGSGLIGLAGVVKRRLAY